MNHKLINNYFFMFLLTSTILEINDNAKETEKNVIQIYQLNLIDEKEKKVES